MAEAAVRAPTASEKGQQDPFIISRKAEGLKQQHAPSSDDLDFLLYPGCGLMPTAFRSMRSCSVLVVLLVAIRVPDAIVLPPEVDGRS